MNKSESKYFNTALLMDEALIKLLAEKNIEFISVKEICEKAGVNRSTFYLHYETIGDLLEETTEYVISRFLAYFDRTQEIFGGHIKDIPLNKLVFINDKYLKPYLQFIYDNRSVFKAAIHNPVSMKADTMYLYMKKHIFEPIMQRFEIPKDEQNYWIAFYLKGIWAIIQEWINRDCKETIEKIEVIIENCVCPERVLQYKKFGE
ncbi:MAG: TetR/AcrR family transcriptional regulator [Acutalibacteraceae bacterium]